MGTVRAKMQCVVNEDWSDGKHVVMQAVYDPDPDSENGKFFKYTPGGSVDLSIVNPAAAAAFEVGKEYFVDFTAADA